MRARAIVVAAGTPFSSYANTQELRTRHHFKASQFARIAADVNPILPIARRTAECCAVCAGDLSFLNCCLSLLDLLTLPGGVIGLLCDGGCNLPAAGSGNVVRPRCCAAAVSASLRSASSTVTIDRPPECLCLVWMFGNKQPASSRLVLCSQLSALSLLASCSPRALTLQEIV
jgi:hypothetical protein